MQNRFEITALKHSIDSKLNFADLGPRTSPRQDIRTLADVENEIQVISVEPIVIDQSSFDQPKLSRNFQDNPVNPNPVNPKQSVETIPIRATILSALFFLPSIVVFVALYAENVSSDNKSISIDFVSLTLLVLRCPTTTFATFKSKNKVSTAPINFDDETEL